MELGCEPVLTSLLENRIYWEMERSVDRRNERIHSSGKSRVRSRRDRNLQVCRQRHPVRLVLLDHLTELERHGTNWSSGMTPELLRDLGHQGNP